MKIETAMLEYSAHPPLFFFSARLLLRVYMCCLHFLSFARLFSSSCFFSSW